MTALTDRYVHAVLRAVPSSQRADLEPEIRALVADAIEAHAAEGSQDPEAAERAALNELGDPTALAARYAERPQYLIGPAIFPEWKRMLTLLLPIIVPIVSAVVLVANLLSNETIGRAIAAAITTGLNVAVQTVFWFTLVFAVIERVVGDGAAPKTTWTVDDLPDLPDDGRPGLVEFAFAVAANVIVVVALLWVQLWPPIVIDGEGFPLFDPALWSFWLPWFLAVAVLETVLAIAVYLRGRWTYPFAVANALLGAAFAVPAVYLLQNEQLFNPALVEKVSSTTGGGAWIQVSALITAVVVVVIVAWDAIDGFRKARRSSKPAMA